MRRQLIVNADDFGLSAETNRGICISHEKGIVTAASLMVRAPAAREAVRYALQHPELDLGLHIDLGEWRWRDGEWRAAYEVVSLWDPDRVEVEVRRQLSAFCDMRGGAPTHIDSHQHVHLRSPVAEIVAAAAADAGVPLRHYGAVRYCGDFYGQAVEGQPIEGALSVAALISIIERLAPGITELACHPGLDDRIDTMYCAERRQEVETLCDPRVRTALATHDVMLTRFSVAAA